MTVAFVTTRSRVRSFSVICALIFALVLVAWRFGVAADRAIDAIATGIGLVLYCSGLLILRAMLNRSVSLDMLMSYSKGQLDPAVAEHFERRLNDALKYRLVRSDAGVWTLSPRGIALDRVSRVLYRLTSLD